MTINLDKKYRDLVVIITNLKINNGLSSVLTAESVLLELDSRNTSRANEKLVSDIYFADEIEWIEPKYNWRLKSRKFDRPYIGSNGDGGWTFLFSAYEEDAMTESELKELLGDTGLSIEAFERVSK